MENKINIIITEEPAEISRDDARALAKYNFATTYSGKDGVELMEKINNVKPDIVLMDMFMTRMDGVGVLRALKRKNPEKMPLVFVYSTFSSPVLEREIMNCGAVYFVLKPYNMEDIAESMISMLNEKYNPAVSGGGKYFSSRSKSMEIIQSMLA